MRTMARLASLVVLASLLSSTSASAVEPVARLKGPATAAVDAEFWLKFAGSVGDEPVDLELASGPESVALALLYDRDGKPVYGIASVGQPGTYVFAVVATGKPEGSEKPRRAYAFWTVVVGDVPPPPPPPPPGSDLAIYVRDVVTKAVPAADRKAGALSIAAAYREAVRLGRDGHFATPQVMVTFVKEAMRTARPASWVGFVLEPKLAELAKAGKLATVADLGRVFEEIATTLEAIADGR